MLERCGRSSKINTYKLNRRTWRCYWLMLRSTSQSSLISCFPGINTRGGMKQMLRIWMKKGAALKYFKGNSKKSCWQSVKHSSDNEKESEVHASSWESRSPWPVSTVFGCLPGLCPSHFPNFLESPPRHPLEVYLLRASQEQRGEAKENLTWKLSLEIYTEGC